MPRSTGCSGSKWADGLMNFAWTGRPKHVLTSKQKLSLATKRFKENNSKMRAAYNINKNIKFNNSSSVCLVIFPHPGSTSVTLTCSPRGSRSGRFGFIREALNQWIRSASDEEWIWSSHHWISEFDHLYSSIVNYYHPTWCKSYVNFIIYLESDSQHLISLLTGSLAILWDENLAGMSTIAMIIAAHYTMSSDLIFLVNV